MRVPANELDFPSTAGKFQSPFLSADAEGNARFSALLGKDSAGVIASMGADAWQQALTRTTKQILTSSVTGGMPVGRINDILWDDDGRLKGLFATAVFPNSTSKDALKNAALEVGLSLAVNALSAVPIAGQVLEAVIAVAKTFAKLFRQEPSFIQRTVPWQEYSRDLDEDIINQIIIKKLSPSVNWTSFFEPPMPPGPFNIKRAGDADENKWAVGVFTSGYQPDYLSGLGYMPGTQRMVEVIQCARVIDRPGWHEDAITNVGEFFPATSQWGTVAWEMVEATANEGTGADLYKIQASKLIGKWQNYWGAYFDNLLGLDRGPGVSGYGDLWHLFLAKAIAKFLTLKNNYGDVQVGLQTHPVDTIRTSGNLYYYINKDIFSPGKNLLSPGRQFYRPDQTLTTPALRRIRNRQLAALSNSLSCAYVRPRKVGSLPAFAAFNDPGPATKSGYEDFGHQLRVECDRVRELLLTHNARWEVATADAMAVDPVFGEKLRESKGVTGIKPVFTSAEPLDPDVDPGPEPEEPKGGVPFGDFAAVLPGDKPKKKKKGWSTGQKVAVGAAVAGAGYLGYKKLKGEPVTFDFGRLREGVRNRLKK